MQHKSASENTAVKTATDTPSKRGRSIEECESQFFIFKRKRAVYNHKEKKAVYSVLQECEHNCNKAHAMLTKSGVQMGYKSVWRINQQIKNGGNASRARGRPIDHDFEKVLLAKVTQVLDKGLNQV